MTVSVIVNIKIADRVRYEGFKRMAAPIVEL